MEFQNVLGGFPRLIQLQWLNLQWLECSVSDKCFGAQRSNNPSLKPYHNGAHKVQACCRRFFETAVDCYTTSAAAAA